MLTISCGFCDRSLRNCWAARAWQTARHLQLTTTTILLSIQNNNNNNVHLFPSYTLITELCIPIKQHFFCLIFILFFFYVLMTTVDDDIGTSHHGSSRRHKRGVLPKKATRVMKAWLFQHLSVSLLLFLTYYLFLLSLIVH